LITFGCTAKTPIITIKSPHGEIIHFAIRALISNRNIEKVSGPLQYEILNSYLRWKGDAFQDTLFNVYKEALSNVHNLNRASPFFPLPVHLLANLLDLINFEEILYFIKDVFKVKPLASLPDILDVSMVINDKGTREQTYLKSDFLDLCALSIIIKMLIPILGELVNEHSAEIDPNQKEFILYQIVNSTKLASIQPLLKVKDMVVVLLKQYLTPQLEKIIVLGKNISDNNIHSYIIAKLLFTEIAYTDILSETDSHNSIVAMHTWTKAQAETGSGFSTRIMEKTPPRTIGGDENGLSESTHEAVRTISDISPGQVTEYIWATDNIDIILKQLENKPYKPKDAPAVIKARDLVNKVSNITIAHMSILGLIFKDLVHPNATRYVYKNNIHNLLAVGYVILIEQGFPDVAALLLSNCVDDSMGINVSYQKSKYTNDILTVFKKYYTLEKGGVNVALEMVNKLAVEHILSKRWIPAFNTAQEHIGSVPSQDIKHAIIALMIHMEELRCYKVK